MTTNLEELSDRLNSMSAERRSRACPYQRMVDTIGAEDEEVGTLLSVVIYDNSIPMRRIHSQLRQYGYAIASDSISLHRSGECTCPQEKV